MPRILVSQPDPALRQHLRELLDAQPAWNTQGCATTSQALDQLAVGAFDLVVADLQADAPHARADVAALLAGGNGCPVLLTGTHGTVDQVVAALSAGATGFIHTKRLDIDLVEQIGRVLAADGRNKTQARLLECMTSSRSEFALENDPALLPALLVRFQASAKLFGVCDEGERARIGMALEEALTNALYHGNLEVSSDLRRESLDRYYDLAADRRTKAPYRDRSIHITETLTPDAATFTIRDEGSGFDTSKLDLGPDPEDLEAVSGRGILLMNAFMDEVRYNGRGNQVTLVKRKAGDGEGLTLAA